MPISIFCFDKGFATFTYSWNVVVHISRLEFHKVLTAYDRNLKFRLRNMQTSRTR